MPTAVPPPPPGWVGPYRVLAESLGIESDLSQGHAMAAGFLDPVLVNRHPVQGLAWDPKSRNCGSHRCKTIPDNGITVILAPNALSL